MYERDVTRRAMAATLFIWPTFYSTHALLLFIILRSGVLKKGYVLTNVNI